MVVMIIKVYILIYRVDDKIECRIQPSVVFPPNHRKFYDFYKDFLKN